MQHDHVLKKLNFDLLTPGDEEESLTKRSGLCDLWVRLKSDFEIAQIVKMCIELSIEN